MPVAYVGPTFRIFLSKEVAEKVEALNCVSDKLTLFAVGKREGASFFVDDFYVPRQTSTQYQNVVSAKELPEIGEKYIGIIRLGKGYSSNFSNDDYNSAYAVCHGVSEYIVIQYDGSYNAFIRRGNYRHDGVSVLVKNNITEEMKNSVKALLGKVKQTDTKIGYTQEKRTNKIECVLLTKNINWESVVCD